MRTERTEETNAAKEERLLARRKRDWELMARVAVGDSEAFGEIWHHYRRWLSFHLYQKGILDADQANDILQEVCLKILRFAHKYDRQIATVGTWFALITDNVVYQHRLKYRRLSNYRFISVDEKYELTSEDQFEGPVSREECKSLIVAALERLAPMLRTAIEMKLLPGTRRRGDRRASAGARSHGAGPPRTRGEGTAVALPRRTSQARRGRCRIAADGAAVDHEASRRYELTERDRVSGSSQRIATGPFMAATRTTGVGPPNSSWPLPFCHCCIACPHALLRQDSGP